MVLALLLVTCQTGVPEATQAPVGAEPVVTARKRDEPLAGVPLSATVVPAQTLEEHVMIEVSDLTSRVPNTIFSEFSARRLSFPFVRGVGSGINDPAVITYVDDVPQFGFGGTNLPLFALESVEFLRGPQGTLYGKSALGGLIHLHGRRPTEERVLGAGATFGSFDLQEFSGSYSGPIGGGVLGDFAILDAKRDGFTKNDFPDSDPGNRVDDRDGLFGRGRVLWNPSGNSELDLSVFGERARDGGFVLSDLDGLRQNPHHIDQDFEGVTERDVLNPALVYHLFGDDLDFTSISSFETWDVLETSDFDFTQFDVVRRRTEEEQDYVYQEFRLGTPDEEGRARGVAWQLGTSGFLSDADRSAANTFSALVPPPAIPGVDLTEGQFDDVGLAVFGQVSVPVGAELELTGGLRYDREDKEVDRTHTFDPGIGPIPVPGPGDDSETFDEVLPMASVGWHASQTALVYVRAAKGFKAGGFNLTAPAGKEDFDAETAWSYELGWRQSFDEERYHLGATAFYIDWSDMQLAQFDAAAGGFVDNAGESTSQGLELEGQAGVTGWLDVNGSFGLLDTEIEEFTDSFGNDTSGNELPFAPDSTWAVGFSTHGELLADTRWTFAGDYTHIGSFFYDAGNLEGDEFGLANLRLGVDTRNVGAAVWVRNLFDEEYEPVAFQPNPADPTAFVGESGAHRVLGFSLSVHL